MTKADLLNQNRDRWVDKRMAMPHYNIKWPNPSIRRRELRKMFKRMQESK